MRDFAWMIRRHQDNILNYFKVRIDNGVVEGLNNKAKVVIEPMVIELLKRSNSRFIMAWESFLNLN
jgi:hypothetical protein